MGYKIKDLLYTLDMYDKPYNRKVIQYIIKNKDDLLCVSDCIEKTNIKRLTAHKIFRKLVDYNILKEINIKNKFNSSDRKKRWLLSKGFSPFTKKIYEVTKEGTKEYINNSTSEIEETISFFIL